MDYISAIRWRPGIGDPSFMGWFTVAAYACGAVWAVLASKSGAKTGNRVQARQRSRLWLVVAVAMACLCLNKQLDLQTLLTDIGRGLAKDQGWYDQRRSFQKGFVLVVLGSAAAFGGWFMWRFHLFWRGHNLLLAGALFLLTFVVVRAISFHHIDEFLGREVIGVRMNWALELSGIALINLAAVREWRGRDSPSTDAVSVDH